MTRVRKAGFDRPRSLWVVVAATLLFLFLPIIVATVYSFNSGSSLAVFEGFSTRWYVELANDADLLESLGLSVLVAVIAMVASTVLGTLIAFGLARGSRRLAQVANAVVFLRLVSPETAIAVALLLMFTQSGITLSLTTMIIAHIALCTVFVAVVVRSRLAAISIEVEEAAMDLGATPLAAVRLATLPLLAPAIVTAALLSFVLSFDNFVTSFFTSGIGTPPLPVRIYSMIRFGVTPEVNAVGVVMLIVTVAAIVLALGASRWLGRGIRTRELP